MLIDDDNAAAAAAAAVVVVGPDAVKEIPGTCTPAACVAIFRKVK